MQIISYSVIFMLKMIIIYSESHMTKSAIVLLAYRFPPCISNTYQGPEMALIQATTIIWDATLRTMETGKLQPLSMAVVELHSLSTVHSLTNVSTDRQINSWKDKAAQTYVIVLVCLTLLLTTALEKPQLSRLSLETLNLDLK